MACNAVVYQPAVVVDDALFKQLANIPRRQLADVLVSFLRSAFPAASNAMPFAYGTVAGVEFNLKSDTQGWRALRIRIAGARLELETIIQDPVADKQLIDAFTALLRRVAGQQMQVALVKAAGRVAKVTNAQPAANGALILSLDL